MRPVNDIPLRDSYDVVVVGAGLGGMTAASLLAKRGLSVLTVEQQGKPGGSCTSFHLHSQFGGPCETDCRLDSHASAIATGAALPAGRCASPSCCNGLARLP